MCIAVPGKVVGIEGNKARVEYHGNVIEVSTGIVSPKVGDYCLIHAGCAVEIIDPKRAGELEDIIGMLEEVMNEEIK